MEIQKTNNIPDEDIQALSWLANTCYTRGCGDTLIGVGIGAALAIVGLPIMIAVASWYDCNYNKKSDEYTQLNAIILAIILNIAAFIVNGMYFSVII